jgi:CheY-like chemotaxis protein
VTLPAFTAPVIGSEEQAGQRIVTSVLAEVRRDLPGLRKATPAVQREALGRLHRRLHQVIGAATVAGRSACADLASAAAALVKSLADFPDRLGPSVLTTLGHAADVLERGMAASADAPVARARALIVDDDAVARATMRHALAKIALATDEADSGERALERLRSTAYAVVLSDVNMARMSGHSLINRMRELPIHRGTPAILVTAIADFGQGFQPSARGAVDCIAKPFLLMELATKTLTHLLEASPTLAAVPAPRRQPDPDPWSL